MPLNDQKNKPNGKQPGIPNLWTWIYIAILAIAMIYFYQNVGTSVTEISWTAFQHDILPSGDVEKIVVLNKEIAEVYLRKSAIDKQSYRDKGLSTTGPHYKFQIGSVESLEAALTDFEATVDPDKSIDVIYKKETQWLWSILSWLLPFILIIAIWVWILRRAGTFGGGGGTGSNIFDFGKSKAKEFDLTQTIKVSFKDVAGLEEAKAEVMEIVEFLRNPGAYTRLGAKIPKGVMLVGPPGTGKTLMAKAVAGEARVPFFSMSGSEFVEMFVGVGASRVRDLFRKAKDKAPSIIFIDEIDAVGRTRGKAASFQSNDERESTLNQLLTEMDGFGTNTGVIVLAATNRADVLDRALLRPGRFDRHIYLELPNMIEREAIFNVHLKPIKLAEDVKPGTLSAKTPGFSGADIANICNEAALIAARKKKNAVEMEDFMEATDRVIAGLEKKSKIISPEEKRIVAYHEAGHATASWFLEHADKLLKVSIVPRGKSLGAAWYLPEEQQIYTKSELIDRLCSALGGRASEELMFNEISSGALDDLEKVTKQAYNMVAYYGLDKEIGNISFFDSTGEYQQNFQKPYSEETARMIDEQVRKLVRKAYARTLELLKAHKKELIILAERLLEKEVIHLEDLELIFGARPGPAPQEDISLEKQQ